MGSSPPYGLEFSRSMTLRLAWQGAQRHYSFSEPRLASWARKRHEAIGAPDRSRTCDLWFRNLCSQFHRHLNQYPAAPAIADCSVAESSCPKRRMHLAALCIRCAGPPKHSPERFVTCSVNQDHRSSWIEGRRLRHGAAAQGRPDDKSDSKDEIPPTPDAHLIPN